MHFLSGHMRGELSSYDHILMTFSKSDFIFIPNTLHNAKHGKRKKEFKGKGKNHKSIFAYINQQ